MELSLLETHLRKIACYLGIFQALGYGAMAMTCVVLYNIDYLNLPLETYMDRVNANMYAIFIGNIDPIFEGQTLYSKNFAVFVWIYFILSLAWFGISVGALVKDGPVLAKYLSVWSHSTLVVSCWDFITVIIIGVDYNKCMSWVHHQSSTILEKISGEGACVTGILPVLVIAARGFVLWIVNVTVAVVLIKMAESMKKRVCSQRQGTLAQDYI